MPPWVHTLIRTSLSLSIVLALVLHASGYFPLTPVGRLEAFAYDVRLRLLLPGGVDPRIAIVDIDESSLLEEGQWPWPRRRLAQLTETLFNDYHIRLLAFDIVFAEAERDPTLAALDASTQDALRENTAFQQKWAVLRSEVSGDARLAAALRNRPTVLGYAFAMPDQQGADLRIGQLPPPVASIAVLADTPNPFATAAGYSANLPLLQNSAQSGGFFNNPLLDQDGLLRRVPLLLRYGDQLYPHLSLAVVRSLLGEPPLTLITGAGYHAAMGDRRVEAVRIGAFEIPIDEQGAVLAPYLGRQGSFPYISAGAILNRRADPHLLTGAIVLVGATAAGLMDLRATPVQNVYPGVEVNANLIAGILDQRLHYRPAFSRGLEIILLVLLGGLGIALGRWSPLGALLGMLTLAAADVALNLYAWQTWRMVIPLASTLILLFLLYVLQSSYGYFVQTRRERRLAQLFGQYVPRELVAEMSRRPGSYGLGGDSREMTVLFSDIQDFTAISENLDPHQLTRLMQFILTPLTHAIHEQRGTVDKYIGDAIMAFWGAPLPDSDHARHAVAAALAMKARLAALKPDLLAHGWPPLRIRIGVNSGTMNVGNMGSEFRVAYTVLGDAVNLASRLESAARQYGATIVISETTRAAVPDIVCRELDRVRVKGRSQPVTLFEPLGPAETSLAAIHEESTRYGQALAAYRARDWAQATVLFQQLAACYPDQALYTLYVKRVAALSVDPPATDWDGVYTLTEK